MKTVLLGLWGYTHRMNQEEYERSMLTLAVLSQKGIREAI